ncbi:MAG: hypothetical protein IPM35_06330 [Myxococcales bacterium]|nr:hypothetical protein [Myxococcales bacterium]
MHTVIQRLVSALAIAPLALACSSDDGGGSGGGGGNVPDACTLLTAGEVEDILGAPTPGVAATNDTPGGTSRRCAWEREYSTVLRNDELVLSVAPVAAYTPLVGSTPYTIGDGGEVLDQTRGVQITWKKAAFAVTFRYAITGALSEDFEPYRVKAKALAQAANDRL